MRVKRTAEHNPLAFQSVRLTAEILRLSVSLNRFGDTFDPPPPPPPPPPPTPPHHHGGNVTGERILQPKHFAQNQQSQKGVERLKFD